MFPHFLNLKGGIKYTAMPPSKRYRDMFLRSGGEKTLAALALVFAVHVFQKPPFMILDEVDAPLDAYNVFFLRCWTDSYNIFKKQIVFNPTEDGVPAVGLIAGTRCLTPPRGSGSSFIHSYKYLLWGLWSSQLFQSILNVYCRALDEWRLPKNPKNDPGLLLIMAFF